MWPKTACAWVGRLHFERQCRSRVLMTCKAVRGHYLDNLEKLGLGQLVPRLVGCIWNGKANVGLVLLARLLVGTI